MISHYSKPFFYQLFLLLSIFLSSCSSDKSNETKVVLKDEFIQKAELKNQEMETLGNTHTHKHTSTTNKNNN